jgi:ribosome-binding protein aMBF1 (putative translation factor)
MRSVVLKVSFRSLYPMKAQKKSKERPSLEDEQKEIQIKIGKRLRQLREATGLSQERFANEHNLNRRLMSRIENGTNFKIDTLVQYIRALDVTLQEFFAGVD